MVRSFGIFFSNAVFIFSFEFSKFLVSVKIVVFCSTVCGLRFVIW